MEAIITDLDGTILPRGGQISAETLDALREAGEKKLTRIIATGRNLFSARKVLSDDFPIDFLVFSSGAGVLRWADKAILSTNHLSIGEAREIADYFWNYNINFTIQKNIPDNHHFYYTDIYPVHADYKERIALYHEFGTLIGSSGEIDSPATQLILILDALQVKLIEQIRSDLAKYSVIRTTSPIDHKAIWLEVFPSGINKGTSCRDLLNGLDIPLSLCAGLGNDYNDVDFLDICGRPFLVANAPQRLKPHYKTVASDINNGFSEFISTILK